MDIGRIKKILSAEFSISENGIITIDGFNYSKNDILLELEKEDFDRCLENHKLIWENKSLLNCLEKNIISFSEIYKWIKLKNIEQFVHFVSPYFAESFDRIMRGLLASFNIEDATRWLNLLVFIDNTEDEDKALSGIRIFLQESLRMLKNVNDVTYINIIPQLDCWIEQPGYLFINNLPASLYKIKNDLVTAFVNFIFLIQHKDRQLCYEISCQLVQMWNIDPELNNLIVANHEIYRSKVTESSRSKADERIRSVAYAVVVIIIIVILKSLFSISSNVSDRSYLAKDQDESTITTEYFLDIRNKYSVIDTSAYKIDLNVDERLVPMLYYIMLERSKVHDYVVVNIANKGTLPVIIYLISRDHNLEPIDLRIDPSDEISIKTNKNVLDLLFKCVSDSIQNTALKSVINKMIVPILASDSLNLANHNVDFEDEGRILYLNEPDLVEKDIFYLNIYSNEEQNHNYLTFGGLEWVVGKKGLKSRNGIIHLSGK